MVKSIILIADLKEFRLLQSCISFEESQSFQMGIYHPGVNTEL